MTWFAGGVSGASHVGCLSSGQSGFCEITYREWSKHASFSHHLQTRGIVQYGRTKLRHFLFSLLFLVLPSPAPNMNVSPCFPLQMHGSFSTNAPLDNKHQVTRNPLVLTAQLSASKRQKVTWSPKGNVLRFLCKTTRLWKLEHTSFCKPTECVRQSAEQDWFNSNHQRRPVNYPAPSCYSQRCEVHSLQYNRIKCKNFLFGVTQEDFFALFL